MLLENDRRSMAIMSKVRVHLPVRRERERRRGRKGETADMERTMLMAILTLSCCLQFTQVGGMVRVSGYRYRGPGFDPRRYQIF